MMEEPINHNNETTTQYRFRYKLYEKEDRSSCNKYYRCKNLDIALSQFEAGCSHRGVTPQNISAFKLDPIDGWVSVAP